MLSKTRVPHSMLLLTVKTPKTSRVTSLTFAHGACFFFLPLYYANYVFANYVIYRKFAVS